MEQYVHNLPFFIFAASIGILGNFLFITKEGKFTKLRIFREVFGGLWISTVVIILLDQLTTLNDPVLFAITSLIAFVNSRIISIIERDLMEAIARGIGRGVKNLADWLRRDRDYDDDFDEHSGHYTPGKPHAPDHPYNDKP